MPPHLKLVDTLSDGIFSTFFANSCQWSGCIFCISPMRDSWSIMYSKFTGTWVYVEDGVLQLRRTRPWRRVPVRLVSRPRALSLSASTSLDHHSSSSTLTSPVCTSWQCQHHSPHCCSRLYYPTARFQEKVTILIQCNLSNLGKWWFRHVCLCTYVCVLKHEVVVKLFCILERVCILLPVDNYCVSAVHSIQCFETVDYVTGTAFGL